MGQMVNWLQQHVKATEDSARRSRADQARRTQQSQSTRTGAGQEPRRFFSKDAGGWQTGVPRLPISGNLTSEQLKKRFPKG